MASAFGWESAWEQIEDDDPHFAGKDYYAIPDEYGTLRVYEGDQFWNTNERYLIEITDVKRKIYRGVVGHKGERGNVCVFYDKDWKRPSDPTTRNHYTDDIHFLSVEEFAEMLDEGDLVPHRGNGLPPRPPY